MVGSLSSEVSWSSRVSLLAVLLCCACTEPVSRTQVTVLVDADSAMREQIRYVDVEIRTGSDSEDVWDAQPAKKLVPRNGAKSWPLSFSLGSPKRRGRIGYQIAATAKDADDRDLAVVRALSYYVEGKSLVLRLRFDEACAARTEPCPTTFTCRKGECVEANVPESELSPSTDKVSEQTMTPGAPAAGSDAPESQAGRTGAMAQAGSGAMPPSTGCSGASCGSCPARDAKGACLPCPAGFLGEDAKHCRPGLISLELSHGTLQPAFDPEKTEYKASVSFLTEEVTLRYGVPAASELLINGRTATGATEWKTGPLELGRTEVVMTLTANGAESRTYTLVLERTLKQESFLASPFPSPGDSFGSRLTISGDLLVVGAPYEDGSQQTPSGAPDESTKDSGAAYVFERTAAGWMHRAYLKTESPRENARMGFSVAANGKRFAVGVPYDAKGGSVYVYEWRDGAAQNLGVLHGDSDGNAQFGRAVALQGDRLVVGAPGDPLGGADAAGAMYVFEYVGGAWQRRAFLKSETPGPLDWLGSGVALDGDIIVGGATGRTLQGQSIFSGCAYVFERTKDGWGQVQMLAPEKVDIGAFFGEWIAMKGTRIAVSGFYGSAGLGGGSVSMFERGDDGKWSEVQTIRPQATGPDWFGGRVFLTDSLLVVGAPHESSAAPGVGADGTGKLDRSGTVYVFSHRGSTWTQALQIKLTEPMKDQQFGFGLGLGADGTLVAGVPSDPDVNGSSREPGGIYVFR